MQLGEKDKIEVARPSVNVSDNLQPGKEHEIQAGVEAEEKPVFNICTSTVRKAR